jgi:hypothetical protein
LDKNGYLNKGLINTHTKVNNKKRIVFLIDKLDFIMAVFCSLEKKKNPRLITIKRLKSIAI